MLLLRNYILLGSLSDAVPRLRAGILLSMKSAVNSYLNVIGSKSGALFYAPETLRWANRQKIAEIVRLLHGSKWR